MQKLSDELNGIYDLIYEISDKFNSHKDAVVGFDNAPVGYKYIYSIDFVDADIRNGGIYQLHSNSAWHLILDAIDGLKKVECRELSICLLEILFYYHKAGRSKMKKRINEEVFASFSNNWHADLDTLENSYYSTFDQLGYDSTIEIWEKSLKDNPDLFTKISPC